MTNNIKQLLLIVVVFVIGTSFQYVLWGRPEADFFTAIFQTNPWLWLLYFLGGNFVVEKLIK
ncbi:hypothetical protein N474_12090 [Pseudoalteromonas luteoviolacea CPMOR-2]|uniref:Uncharacterized protein n=1 Tax=Pseudoalteromonas luteoviolacea DSM 6061 TaxID=1365250 RepID=A0A162A0N2_9GAMM|nr:hypothetical protein [Pseudoalteromonas luteoviolacea]KZN40895.1 hypothetical protein N475_00545 [Pseudoalteromonas luteoviolacea DSM 6061]KZN56481.1 hypothetical protein N474_12090 [Pseudoalteromonas luteoviolacea CPMOR-2]